MLLLFSFAMTGMLLHYGTNAGIRQTRESIGGGFRIAPDMQNRDNVEVSTADGLTSIAYIGQPLDEKVIHAILARPNIGEYNSVLRKIQKP